jgi:hypothetical protein
MSNRVTPSYTGSSQMSFTVSGSKKEEEILWWHHKVQWNQAGIQYREENKWIENFSQKSWWKQITWKISLIRQHNITTDFNTSTPSSSIAGLSARSANFNSMGFEEFHCTEMNSQWFPYIQIITPSSTIWTTMRANLLLKEKYYVLWWVTNLFCLVMPA